MFKLTTTRLVIHQLKPFQRLLPQSSKNQDTKIRGQSPLSNLKKKFTDELQERREKKKARTSTDKSKDFPTNRTPEFPGKKGKTHKKTRNSPCERKRKRGIRVGIWIGGVWNGHFPDFEQYFSEAENLQQDA